MPKVTTFLSHSKGPGRITGWRAHSLSRGMASGAERRWMMFTRQTQAQDRWTS